MLPNAECRMLQAPVPSSTRVFLKPYTSSQFRSESKRFYQTRSKVCTQICEYDTRITIQKKRPNL